ncbi:MAG: bifunctional phosphoribosyl-AMP cyclohydrolase/phosphoribosyl-ATP diphosphatase HisIE [Wenzhouxiangellaceae bacterium]
MTSIDSSQADWDKGHGLLPAIIQDVDTAQVLMLGYMNEAALQQTQDSGWVTFFSRSKQRLWTKGETSGHRLATVNVALDCDRDTLLVQARRTGPVCHLGSRTCWGGEAPAGIGFIGELSAIIRQRADQQADSSYTSQLLQRGLPRIAQKVGEEGVEAALAAVCGDADELTGEAADLIYHLLVLLQARGLSINQICECLAQRHQQRSPEHPGD